MSVPDRKPVLVPKDTVPVVEPDRRVTPEWQRYLRQLQDAQTDIQTIVAALRAAGIPGV